MTVRDDGNVGIGTDNPTATLHVIGNVFATGGVASSKELKENIFPLSTREAMATLEQLDSVKFNYKDDPSHDLQLGFIAEDVPDLVATPGRKGIQPMDIVAVLTKVVQEQQKTILLLEERLKVLEDAVAPVLHQLASR